MDDMMISFPIPILNTNQVTNPEKIGFKLKDDFKKFQDNFLLEKNPIQTDPLINDCVTIDVVNSVPIQVQIPQILDLKENSEQKPNILEISTEKKKNIQFLEPLTQTKDPLRPFQFEKRETIIPFIKKFVSKLKNNTPFRNISMLKKVSFNLLNDKSFFIDEVLKEKALMDEKNFCKKFFSSLKKKIELFIYFLISSFIYRVINNFFEKHIKVLHPFENKKILWDLIHMVIILFWFFYCPLLIGFEEVQPLEYDCSQFTSIFLLLDFVISLNTAYFMNGTVEKSRKNIIKNYFNNFFLLDLFTFLPISFPVLVNYFLQINTSEILIYGSLKLSPLLNLIFFLRFRHFKVIYRRILEKFLIKEKFQNILALIQILFTTIIIAHFFACLWHYSTLINYQTGEQTVWVSKITKLGMADSLWIQTYLYSIYWSTITMMTVGYGDLVPGNTVEIIITIITVLLGCGVYAFNINSFGMILKDISKEDIDFRHNVNIINQFMKRKKINQDLQMRIREYLRFIWKEEKTQNSEEAHKIINVLSYSLRDELLLESYGTVLRKYSMFWSNFSDTCLRKTVNVIKDYKFMPDDLIFEENEINDCSIYFIIKGKITLSYTNLSNEEQIKVTTLNEGDLFGEISFFTGKQRLCSAKSLGFTTLYAIKREDFIKILEEFQDDYEKFAMISDQILLYGNYGSLKIRCFSCNQLGHISSECPQLHYIADKERIIKSFNYYLDQERDPNFKRRDKLIYFNAKKNKIAIKEAIEKFNLSIIEEKKKKDKEKSKAIHSLLRTLTGAAALHNEDSDFSEIEEEEEQSDEQTMDEENEQEEINEIEGSEEMNDKENESIISTKKTVFPEMKESSFKPKENESSNYIKTGSDMKESLFKPNSKVNLNMIRHSACAIITNSSSENDSGFIDKLKQNKKRTVLPYIEEMSSNNNRSSLLTHHERNRTSVIDHINIMERSDAFKDNKLSKKTYNNLQKDKTNSKNSTTNLGPPNDMRTSIVKRHSQTKISSETPINMASRTSILSTENKNEKIVSSILKRASLSPKRQSSPNQISLNTLPLYVKETLARNSSEGEEINVLNELIKDIERFETVKNFKNYFPDNNCKCIILKMEEDKKNFATYGEKKRSNIKLMNRLSKYTFFSEEMKGKMPEEIKKRIRMQNKKKNSKGYTSHFTENSKDSAPSPSSPLSGKKKTAFFDENNNSNQNKMNFFDLVEHIVKNQDARKIIKKKYNSNR